MSTEIDSARAADPVDEAPLPTHAVPLRHRRIGRRRQVHPGGPAPARLEGDPRRPARRRRPHLRGPRVRRGRRDRRTGDRPRPAHRRPARRARAGHHDRRRLPLLRHGPAQLHPRGLPRARAVHQEHGDRRVHRGRRRRAHRRPQGCPRADPPAPVRAAAAARGARDRRREQDRPGGLQRGRVPRDRGGRAAGRARTRARFDGDRRSLRHPRLRARRRQRGGPLGPHAVVRRPGAAGGPGDAAGRRRTRKPPRKLPFPGPAGGPAAGRAGSGRRRRRARRRGLPRLPRLRRPDHRRLRETGGQGQRPDPGPGAAHHHGDRHRLRGTAAHRGRGPAVRGPAPGGRVRRRPR